MEPETASTQPIFIVRVAALLTCFIQLPLLQQGFVIAVVVPIQWILSLIPLISTRGHNFTLATESPSNLLTFISYTPYLVQHST